MGTLTTLCLQVQDEEPQVNKAKGGDETKAQEPWIGLVPVKMEESKASTGNQESFAAAVVSKVRILSRDDNVFHTVVECRGVQGIVYSPLFLGISV